LAAEKGFDDDDLEAQQTEDCDEDMSEFDPEVLEYFAIIVDDLRKSLRTITWPAQQRYEYEYMEV
jgi:hypothetical protein